MNIYLTSYGLDVRYNYLNSYDEIIKLLTDHNVAIIVNAKLESEDRTSPVVSKTEMESHGISVDLIDLDQDNFDITKYNALYLSGGEPKYIMDAINRNNLFDVFDEYFKSGGLVIGQSAGAMIFNKDYLDTTDGDLKTQHNGFDYNDKIIVPHYDHLPDDIITNLPKDIMQVRDEDNLIKLG